MSVKKYYEAKIEDIVQAFSHEFLLPPEEKTDPTTLPVVHRKRKFRTQYPDEPTQKRMRDCEQNSDEWHDHRKLQIGGSEPSAITGRDHFIDNVTKFQRDAGWVAVIPSLEPNDYIPLDRGHWCEAELTRIFEVVMNAKVTNVGLVLHWRFPFLHISPDGLVQLAPGCFHNRYTVNDMCRTLLELKSPIHKNYSTKGLGRNLIPATYISQLLMQMDTFLVPYIYFTSGWKINEWSAPLTAPTIGKEEMEIKGCDRYLVGEVRITRMNANRAAANVVIQHVVKYMASLNVQDIVHTYSSLQKLYPVRKPRATEDMWVWRVPQDDPESKQMLRLDSEYGYGHAAPTTPAVGEKDRQGHAAPAVGEKEQGHAIILMKNFREGDKIVVQYPPKLLLNGVKLPPVVVLPMKVIKFYLHPAFDVETQRYSAPTVEGDRFMQGSKTCEIEHLFDQKPLLIKMEDLEDATDHAIELDELPFVNEAEGCVVVNPMLKKRMLEKPGARVQDVLWDFIMGA